MSTFSKIFWGAILALSLTISIYQLVTTGTADTYHLIVSFIALAVIDITNTPKQKPVLAYKKGSLSPENEAKLLAGESFQYVGVSSDIIRLA